MLLIYAITAEVTLLIWLRWRLSAVTNDVSIVSISSFIINETCGEILLDFKNILLHKIVII